MIARAGALGLTGGAFDDDEACAVAGIEAAGSVTDAGVFGRRSAGGNLERCVVGAVGQLSS
ncbi:hypothetical protein ABIE33_002955 [Ensifer sp. 4252]